ncbi:hypothetical protein D9619_005548 [Psilocybe cf. subviscida]|uniref:Uncharacterized protein n=1 Tax=Psilocybe cf. subviscida TaxID=2480587 RepID=A0A8H5BWC9_9AGAR|nr:hypothetical protein D9619_005548 [Psilocybe cf. subviscida]
MQISGNGSQILNGSRHRNGVCGRHLKLKLKLEGLTRPSEDFHLRIPFINIIRHELSGAPTSPQ